MKVLFAVDVQPEFVKDMTGKKVYTNCIDYINQYRGEYNYVLAAVYKNENNSVLQRFVDYNECRDIAPLDFIPDKVQFHSGYSISEYPKVRNVDQVDIIGFDTDACVLSAAFHLFETGCNMRLLTNLIWSSGGEKMHKAGLAVMTRQFGKAVV